MGLSFSGNGWRSMAFSAAVLVATIVVSLVVRAIAFAALKRLTRRKGALLGESLVRHGQRPSQWILPFLAVLVVVPALPLPDAVNSGIEHTAGLGLIATVAWLAILLIDVTSDILSGRYRIDVADNLTARRIQTQFQMIRRVGSALVVLVALAIGLMTFPAIKHIGVSILASAGVVSLVVGMAMKDTFANMIAGIQIAFAQPFRIGDAVVVEGEWGWIEEIGMMYVVVRIWDLRRLVLPLSYFLTNPFQNWTRNSADLLAHCFLYVDYTVPVDAVREELRRICAGSTLWNGQVCVLQVSEIENHTMQLRALMDVRSSSDAWDLRCVVREKLVDFLQRNYPQSLPRYRGEFDAPPVKSSAA